MNQTIDKSKENKKTTKNRSALVSKVARVILAGRRRATAKTKKRGEVSGGGRKPFRQKGTGRARAGSNRSPIWRGGGVTFGPTGDQSYKLSATKKEKKIALLAVLSQKESETVNLSLPKMAKTREAAEFLKKNELIGNVLILSEATDEKLKAQRKVFANIPNVKVMSKKMVNVYDVLWARKIVNLSSKEVKTVSDKSESDKKETK